jgi:hypothetical protein
MDGDNLRRMIEQARALVADEQARRLAERLRLYRRFIPHDALILDIEERRIHIDASRL